MKLESSVNIARFGKGYQERFVTVVAGLGDDRELARRIRAEPRSLNHHLDAPRVPVSDQAGQDERAGAVRISL